jgi:hypothetical protein
MATNRESEEETPHTRNQLLSKSSISIKGGVETFTRAAASLSVKRRSSLFGGTKNLYFLVHYV